MSIGILCVVAALASLAVSVPVDYHLTKVPTIVEEVFWCGAEGRTVLLLTQEKHVFRSEDEGNSWHPIHAKLQQHGRRVAGTDQEVGDVKWIQVSPLDSQLVMFFGDGGVVWVSEDCGSSVRALYHGRFIVKYTWHPTEPQWGLALSHPPCDDPSRACSKRQELIYTPDLGHTWEHIASDISHFGWGLLDDQHQRSGIPSKRILAVREKKHGAGGPLLQSDDFFASKPKTLLPHAHRFALSEDFLYVSEDAGHNQVKLAVAHRRSHFQHFQAARLPFEHLRNQKGFTIIDTSEGAAMIHIDHSGANFGNVYISDASGVSFSLSLEGNVRGQNGVCDIERIWGLQGIYFANAVDESGTEWFDEFEDYEPLSQQDEIMSSKSASSSYARDQAQWKQHSNYYEDFETERLAKQKKTYVTFNKGGRWTTVTPPDADSHGKAIRCQSSLGCSLHFHAASTQQHIAPLYSFQSSPGLVIANGNVGPHLDSNPAVVNTYLSRDGGKSWIQIMRGGHVYQFGNYGSLIVMAPDMRNTTTIMFSWDEGMTWDYETISDTPIVVENIMIEPSAGSQKFIVIGFYPTTYEGVVVHLDFSGLHTRPCGNPFFSQNSDFEKWSPYDGRHGANCLLGRHITYTRRRRDAKCYLETPLPSPYTSHCSCTDQDYECDEGYARETQNSPCVMEQSLPQMKTHFLKENEKLSYDPKAAKARECAESVYYFETQGYRKVAGNTCYGGLDRNPKRHYCSTLHSVGGVLLRAAAVVLIVGLVAVFCRPEMWQGARERLRDVWDRVKESVGGRDQKQQSGTYEQVGFASVPDHYEDEDEEDSPPPKKKEDKEEQQHPEKKEDDLLEGGPLEL